MDPFQIDPHALDRELLKQPGMTRDAGEAEADARHAHDQAKARLAVTEARLALAVRKNPSRYDLRDKPTVDEIEAAVVCTKEYQDAQREVIEAKYRLDVRAAHAMAQIDRRKAVERLVDLIALNYYAEREPKPHTEGGREQAAEVRRREIREVRD